MELRDYQLEGIAWLEKQENALLGDEMGLGKSVQLIRASRGRTLVVAPAMMLDSGTWEDEVAKWADDPSRFTFAAYTKLNARGTREVRGEAKETPEGYMPGEVKRVSIGTTKLKEEYNQPWDTLILDEAHYVKNGQSQRTAAVRKLAKNATRVFMATGTPVPNWAHELFVLLQLIHPEEAKPGGRLGSKWRWIEQWFTQRPDPFRPHSTLIGNLIGCTPLCQTRPPTDPCVHFRSFAEANFAGRFLQRMRDEVLTDLPPLTEQRIEIPMVPKQWTAYKQMREKYLAEVDGTTTVAWSSGSRTVYLDRLTSGLHLMDGTDYRESNKMDRLRMDLENRSRPTLVVAHYGSTIEAARLMIQEMGLSVETIYGGTAKADRAPIVRKFQSGGLDVLIGSLETIAEGLTLTAADLVIMLETSYKPTRNQQVKRRIHRLGQTRPCVVLDYLTVGPKGQSTLDVKKRELLESKTDNQTRTLSAARFAELL